MERPQWYVRLVPSILSQCSILSPLAEPLLKVSGGRKFGHSSGLVASPLFTNMGTAAGPVNAIAWCNPFAPLF